MLLLPLSLPLCLSLCLSAPLLHLLLSPPRVVGGGGTAAACVGIQALRLQIGDAELGSQGLYMPCLLLLVLRILLLCLLILLLSLGRGGRQVRVAIAEEGLLRRVVVPLMRGAAHQERLGFIAPLGGSEPLRRGQSFLPSVLLLSPSRRRWVRSSSSRGRRGREKALLSISLSICCVPL